MMNEEGIIENRVSIDKKLYIEYVRNVAGSPVKRSNGCAVAIIVFACIACLAFTAYQLYGIISHEGAINPGSIGRLLSGILPGAVLIVLYIVFRKPESTILKFTGPSFFQGRQYVHCHTTISSDGIVTSWGDSRASYSWDEIVGTREDENLFLLVIEGADEAGMQALHNLTIMEKAVCLGKDGFKLGSMDELRKILAQKGKKSIGWTPNFRASLYN